MKTVYENLIFGDKNVAKKEIEERIKLGDSKSVVPLIPFFDDDKGWISSKVDEIIKNLTTEQSDDFEFWDEFIFYITYIDDGDKYLETIYPQIENLKLKLEIVTSIYEINNEKGRREIKKWLDSDDMGELSVAIFLIHRFRIKDLTPQLHEIMKKNISEELKYQIIFTLGVLEDSRVYPLLVKGATIKNDRQLDYLESLKHYKSEETISLLKKEASKFFQNKLIKLKLAELIYKHDVGFSNSIFKKYIFSGKLDLQGYVLEILTMFKNNSFIDEVNTIFQKKSHFHLSSAIRYFGAVNNFGKLEEIKKDYKIERKTIRQEVMKAVISLDKTKESQYSFYKTLEEDDQLYFLKRKADSLLKKRLKTT